MFLYRTDALPAKVQDTAIKGCIRFAAESLRFHQRGRPFAGIEALVLPPYYSICTFSTLSNRSRSISSR